MCVCLPVPSLSCSVTATSVKAFPFVSVYLSIVVIYLSDLKNNPVSLPSPSPIAFRMPTSGYIFVTLSFLTGTKSVGRRKKKNCTRSRLSLECLGYNIRLHLGVD